MRSKQPQHGNQKWWLVTSGFLLLNVSHRSLRDIVRNVLRRALAVSRGMSQLTQEQNDSRHQVDPEACFQKGKMLHKIECWKWVLLQGTRARALRGDLQMLVSLEDLQVWSSRLSLGRDWATAELRKARRQWIGKERFLESGVRSTEDWLIYSSIEGYGPWILLWGGGGTGVWFIPVAWEYRIILGQTGWASLSCRSL